MKDTNQTVLSNFLMFLDQELSEKGQLEVSLMQLKQPKQDYTKSFAALISEEISEGIYFDVETYTFHYKGRPEVQEFHEWFDFEINLEPVEGLLELFQTVARTGISGTLAYPPKLLLYAFQV